MGSGAQSRLSSSASARICEKELCSQTNCSEHGQGGPERAKLRGETEEGWPGGGSMRSWKEVEKGHVRPGKIPTSVIKARTLYPPQWGGVKGKSEGLTQKRKSLGCQLSLLKVRYEFRVPASVPHVPMGGEMAKVYSILSERLQAEGGLTCT